MTRLLGVILAKCPDPPRHADGPTAVFTGDATIDDMERFSMTTSPTTTLGGFTHYARVLAATLALAVVALVGGGGAQAASAQTITNEFGTLTPARSPATPARARPSPASTT